MLQLKNHTPFVGEILVAPDPQGIDSLYTVMKGTFLLGEELIVADKQVPITLSDEYHGEPGKSSLKRASDLELLKPGTDVLLQGKAYALGGKPVTRLDVSLAVGPIRKTIRVYGDRMWGFGLSDAMSEPEPFVEMPLVWERAFGGTDHKKGNPAQPYAENRNPVGTGFRAPGGQKTLSGMMLPNLEDPTALISSPKDHPPPAAFAPICPDWEPRRGYAGTYDQHWQEHSMPYLPADFDARFFQLAPKDLVVPGFLTGHETVVVQGVSPRGSLQFSLPGCRVSATYHLDRKKYELPMNLDALILEPDDSRIQLVWRTAFACDKKTLRIREVEVRMVSGVAA